MEKVQVPTEAVDSLRLIFFEMCLQVIINEQDKIKLNLYSATFQVLIFSICIILHAYINLAIAENNIFKVFQIS